VDLGDAVPDAVRDVANHFGDLHVPEDLHKEVRTIYMLGAAGKCMMCGRPVAEEALIVVNTLGINQLWCSHKCMQDMNVMGWLQQMYDDIKEAVEFRGSDSH